MTPTKKPIRIVLGTLAVYALLVATHLGEFWPFSIYPMFSSAGQPWTRAVVREMPPDTDDLTNWDAVAFSELPGDPYPLVPRGINQNDVANYVSKTESWTPQRQRGLRNLFAKSRALEQPLLVMKVRGALQSDPAAGDSVAIQARPVMLITLDSLRLRPDLVPPALASHSHP